MRLIHDAAAGVDGFIVVGVGRCDPDSDVKSFQHYRARVGDVDKTVEQVMDQDGVPNANVWIGLFVVGPDTPRRSRGDVDTCVAVLGLVADLDRDKGDKSAGGFPIPDPTYVVETSPGNEQPALIFDKPMPYADAKQLAKRLSTRVGGDAATGDPLHIWRVDGTANWPDRKKIDRGRSRNPHAVRMVKENLGRRFTREEIACALGIDFSAPAPKPSSNSRPPEPWSEDAERRVRSALKSVPSLDRDRWLRVGLALADLEAADPDWPGREIWDAWSKTSPEKFDPRDQDRSWHGFLNRCDYDGERVTVATIFHWAREAGWVDPRGELPAAHDQPGQAARPRVIDRSAPFETAQLFRALRYDAGGEPTLRHHRGVFYAWNGTGYPERDDGSIRAEVYRFLDGCVTPPKKGGAKLVPVKPDPRCVSDVIDALRAVTYLEGSVEAPRWLSQPPSGVAAEDIIACANGLRHVPLDSLLSHTPSYFNHNVTDFDFDLDAPRPTCWLKFLDQLWPEDRDSIETLQEVFGYCLTGDTSQQKAFMIVGPKRSGKGTIARVLRRTIGVDNVVAPTMASLGSNFGLSPLIGKRAAIVSDARLGGRTDRSVVVERLLSITGEDTITVDRKYREHWTGRLGVRFLIFTNELPRLANSSGAFASRFILLALTESFYGREDPGLTDRLLAERPGIFNWAIDGLRRLRERGYFRQPGSAQEALTDMEDLASPLGAFLHDCCEVGAGKSAGIEELFSAWEVWCRGQRRDWTGDKQSFGRDLRAALPGIKTSRPRTPQGERERLYEGVAVKDPVAALDVQEIRWSEHQGAGR